MMLLIQSACLGCPGHRELSVVLEREASLPMPGKCHSTDPHSHTWESSSAKTLGSSPWKTALFRNKSWSILVTFTKYQMSAFKKMDHERMCHWVMHGML